MSSSPKVVNLAEWKNDHCDKMICPDCGYPMDKFFTKNLSEVIDNSFQDYLICTNCDKVFYSDE